MTQSNQYDIPTALTYILEEGPNQGVHILLHVDKPANILFKGDYDANATDKFRHKIMLRSENKYLFSMRFSQEIDVEMLNDKEITIREMAILFFSLHTLCPMQKK